MLEGAPRSAGCIQVGGVVGVHEDVRARLELREDAALGLPHEGAGASTADGLADETVVLQQLPGLAHSLRVCVMRRAPFGVVANVLRRAVVGLQAAEPQAGRPGDAARQVEHRLSRLHAGARASAVDLHQDGEGDAEVAGGAAVHRHLIRDDR